MRFYAHCPRRLQKILNVHSYRFIIRFFLEGSTLFHRYKYAHTHTLLLLNSVRQVKSLSVQFIGLSDSYNSHHIIQTIAPASFGSLRLLCQVIVPRSSSSCPSLRRHCSFSTVHPLLIKRLIVLVDTLTLFNKFSQPHHYLGFFCFETPLLAPLPLSMEAVNL